MVSPSPFLYRGLVNIKYTKRKNSLVYQNDMLGCFFKKEKALRNLGAYSFNRLVPFFCTKNGEATMLMVPYLQYRKGKMYHEFYIRISFQIERTTVELSLLTNPPKSIFPFFSIRIIINSLAKCGAKPNNIIRTIHFLITK